MTSTKKANLNAAHRADRTTQQRQVLAGIAVGAFLLATCLTLLAIAPAAESGEQSKDLTIIAATQTLPIVIDGWCLDTEKVTAPRVRCQVRVEKTKRVASGGELYYLMVFTADGREVQTISIYPVGEERIIYRREPK